MENGHVLLFPSLKYPLEEHIEENREEEQRCLDQVSLILILFILDPGSLIENLF